MGMKWSYSRRELHRAIFVGIRILIAKSSNNETYRPHLPLYAMRGCEYVAIVYECTAAIKFVQVR